MRRVTWIVPGISAALLCSVSVSTQAQGPAGTFVYEGARLIIGDASAPIENGAFVVVNGTITAVGARGSVNAPSGATRVDLTGKTVMPAIVNAHSHVGYERYTTYAGDSRPEYFTAENILDHLQREAFYGVGTVHDGGSAALDVAQQYLVDSAARKYPPAALYSLMAGIVPINGGPDHILIKATRPLRANFEVTRAPEARAAVQLVHAKGVRHIKMWYGDRNGTYPAMPRELYDAAIDEAHKVGIKIHVHASNNLRDQKDAVRSGADVLVHSLQGVRMDDELIALVKEKKPYWTTVMGLGDRSELCEEEPFATQTLTPKIIADVRGNDCKPNPNAATREANLKYNFMRMIESGARLILGSDTGVFPRYTFGWADHHEMQRYVELGLTPAQAIVASTSRPAEALGLKEVGSLAAGKQADFIVLDASPLDDIRNTRKIAAVYLRGAKVDREALLAKWRRASATAQ